MTLQNVSYLYLVLILLSHLVNVFIHGGLYVECQGTHGLCTTVGQSDFQAALRHLATTNNDIDGSSRDIILYLDEGSVLYTNQIVPQGQSNQNYRPVLI